MALPKQQRVEEELQLRNSSKEDILNFFFLPGTVDPLRYHFQRIPFILRNIAFKTKCVKRTRNKIITYIPYL